MKTMKYILGIIGTSIIIWSLLDKQESEYKIYIQVLGVILFFYVMMQLMDKTPSKNESSNDKDNLEKKDKNEELD